MATASSLKGYRHRHRLQEKLGVFGFWGGALMLLVDMTTPFPTPARGAFAMWWLLVVAAGAVMWILSRKLPVEELLQLAEANNGELTAPLVARELGLPIGMATKTLDAACDDGEAELVQTGHSRTWFFYNTNQSNGRLARALEQARQANGAVQPQDLLQANIAHDLAEAEAMLDRLARKGYIPDWRKSAAGD